MRTYLCWVVALLFAAAAAQSHLPQEVKDILQLLNQEPGNIEDPDGSGDEDFDDSHGICFDSNDPRPYIRWVTHDRASGVDTVPENYTVDEACHRMPANDSDRPACSSEPGQNRIVDPIYEFIRYGMDDVEEIEPYLNSLNTSTYPGYAMGLLTNNRCTAFLVGPYHAITTAECVYDAIRREWHTDGMDMWLARDCNTMVTKLLWSSVKIPHQYYAFRNPQHNWAYIEFDPASGSDVWLPFAYDSTLQYRYGPVVVGGYPPDKPLGCPFSIRCLTRRVEEDSCMLSVSCNTPATFPGGPVVAADFIARRTETPPVYGVIVQNRKAIRFTRTMFWLICSWMEQSGHEPGCQNNHYFDGAIPRPWATKT